MAIHFSDIGFDLDEYDFLDELSYFVDDNMHQAVTYENNGKAYLMIPVDGVIEMWFPVIDGEVMYESVQPHYHTEDRIEAKSPVWVDYDENGMSGMLKCMRGDHYPMNLNIPCVDEVPEVLPDRVLEIETACFAESADVYEDVEDFRENCEYGEGFEEKSFIPTGCFSNFGNDDVAETPRAMITGIVTEAETCRNSYTDHLFYKVRIDTVGGPLTALIAEELIYEQPEPGNVIMGKFWLSGRVRT